MTVDVEVVRPSRLSLTVPRVDAWTLAFVGLASAAVIFLLWLARGLTFFWDEWAWIYERQSWSFDSLMSPVP